MTLSTKVGILVLLAAAVALAVTFRSRVTGPVDSAAPSIRGSAAGSKARVPRLVDLGAHSCIPCRMMAPILDGLRKQYAGRMQVDFIDVRQNPDAGRAYGIRVIPTQIFYDAQGRELARHEGFMSKQDILDQWAKLGFDFDSPAAGTP